MSAVAEAVAAGTLPGRVWMYSNYHCNLACSYCLTESAPGVAKRQLTAASMLRIADQAVELGFTGLGVTGGEPFLSPTMAATLMALSERLPVVALSNATLFEGSRLEALAPLAGADVAIQISLDSADPIINDAARAPDNFAKVVEAVPRLIERGIEVRIATTVDDPDADDLARLCELHRGLGVSDDHHIVRPIVRRGRAVDHDLGVDATNADLPAELTVTADGAFWSPFGPTVHNGVVDLDLLITRTTDPLAVPAGALLALVEARPAGADQTLNIR